MEKKSFVVLLFVILLTFAATTIIGYYRAPVEMAAKLENLPLSKGEWVGSLQQLPESIVELLSPDQFFAASFSDGRGHNVQLFVDYFSPGNMAGAIHSPRNCLPGSGWVIEGSVPRNVELGNRRIGANRFHLSLGEAQYVMDFWYITRLGETASDYRLKFNTMISSLILRPTDKAFVRFVASDDEGSVAAMEDFEAMIVEDIYRNLPF